MQANLNSEGLIEVIEDGKINRGIDASSLRFKFVMCQFHYLRHNYALQQYVWLSVCMSEYLYV